LDWLRPPRALPQLGDIGRNAPASSSAVLATKRIYVLSATGIDPSSYISALSDRNTDEDCLSDHPFTGFVVIVGSALTIMNTPLPLVVCSNDTVQQHRLVSQVRLRIKNFGMR